MTENNFVFNKHHYFILTDRGPDNQDVYVCRYAWVRDQAQRKGFFAVLADDIRDIKDLKQELAAINQAESALILADALEILGGKLLRRPDEK
jgi:hypothetical protein